MIYTHVLPNGPLGVASPADTPEPGTDIGLMLRQMAVMMKKLAPMAANLPDAPSPVETFSDCPPHTGGSILLPQTVARSSKDEPSPSQHPAEHSSIRSVA